MYSNLILIIFITIGVAYILQLGIYVYEIIINRPKLKLWERNSIVLLFSIFFGFIFFIVNPNLKDTNEPLVASSPTQSDTAQTGKTNTTDVGITGPSDISSGNNTGSGYSGSDITIEDPPSDTIEPPNDDEENLNYIDTESYYFDTIISLYDYRLNDLNLTQNDITIRVNGDTYWNEIEFLPRNQIKLYLHVKYRDAEIKIEKIN